MDNEKDYVNSFYEVLKNVLGEKIFNVTLYGLILITIAFYVFVIKNIESVVSINVLIVIIISFIMLFVISTIVMNYYILKEIAKKNNSVQIAKLISDNAHFLVECKKCAIEKVENDSFLSYYNLVTFDELLKIEGTLNKNDEVIIYTSHLDTENPAEDIVKDNITRGVLYRLLFYNGQKAKESELIDIGYKEVLRMPKSKNSFDSKLSNSTGFDLMLYKHKNQVEAFFCVNFSVGSKSCLNEGCPNLCDKGNKYLFYKKIEDNFACSIYDYLSQIIILRKGRQI